MKIVGTVAPEEVPQEGERNTRERLWVPLARRAIKDYHGGQVTVVEVENRQELNRLRNGTLKYWRENELRCTPVVVPLEGVRLKVFLELRPIEHHPPRARLRRPSSSLRATGT